VSKDLRKRHGIRTEDWAATALPARERVSIQA